MERRNKYVKIALFLVMIIVCFVNGNSNIIEESYLSVDARAPALRESEAREEIRTLPTTDKSLQARIGLSVDENNRIVTRARSGNTYEYASSYIDNTDNAIVIQIKPIGELVGEFHGKDEFWGVSDTIEDKDNRLLNVRIEIVDYTAEELDRVMAFMGEHARYFRELSLVAMGRDDAKNALVTTVRYSPQFDETKEAVAAYLNAHYEEREEGYYENMLEFELISSSVNQKDPESNGTWDEVSDNGRWGPPMLDEESGS